jgi:hypothetical protein
MKTLCSLSFENGIAIRGAINYGDYILEDKIFASKAIIEAYRLGEDLDFSGIVLCEGLIKYCNAINSSDDFINMLLNFYIANVSCPLKTGECELKVVDWMVDFGKDNDLRQYLYNSFSKHNKKISKSVIRKIENTEHVLRSIRAGKSIDVEEQNSLDLPFVVSQFTEAFFDKEKGNPPSFFRTYPPKGKKR